MDEIIKILKEQKVFDTRNGSIEFFLDDIGVLQKIVLRQSKRKYPGEPFEVRSVKNGKAVASYGNDGVLLQVSYENILWRKP